MIICQLLGPLCSRDFSLNLIAELIGVALEATIVYLLLQRYIDQKEKRKWRITRQALGERIGWLHTILMDEVLNSDRNAYAVVHTWADKTTAEIRRIKSEYSYAFDAKVAEDLENYELFVRQTAPSIEFHQLSNFKWFDSIDKMAIDFLRSASVLENDIVHLFQWGEEGLRKLKERLGQSDPKSGEIPPPRPTHVRF